MGELQQRARRHSQLVPEGALLLGLEAAPLRQTFRTFLTFVHADDRDSLTEQMQERVSACQDYEIDYRIVRGARHRHRLRAGLCGGQTAPDAASVSALAPPRISSLRPQLLRNCCYPAVLKTQGC